jgi:hypothetical protein
LLRNTEALRTPSKPCTSESQQHVVLMPGTQRATRQSPRQWCQDGLRSPMDK